MLYQVSPLPDWEEFLATGVLNRIIGSLLVGGFLSLFFCYFSNLDLSLLCPRSLGYRSASRIFTRTTA